MSDKDAKLVESLARADIRNQFMQKIAAAVAASPALATSRQKKANDILSRVGGSLRDAAGAAKDYAVNSDTAQYLNAKPVLALALGGAGLGGASALSAGLYSKKKPRRILGHTIGGALAGAALGGGLGAIGHSINRGGTLSSWFSNAKDFVKPKDVAEDKFQDKTVNDSLQQESPALHAAWEKAQRDVEVNNSGENRARLAQLKDLFVKIREYGLKPDPGSQAYPGVGANTELNTSPFQLGTMSGDRDSPGLLSPLKLIQGIDAGAAGLAAFNRQLIKHKYSPLSNVDISKPGVQRWLGERLYSTLDAIKSEPDASKKLILARELLGAPLTVPDEHIKHVIDQMYDRANAVVNNGASVDSLFDDIASGRKAVDPSLATEISKKWRDASSANPTGFARQLAGESSRPVVSIKPNEWNYDNISSPVSAKLELDKVLKMKPDAQAAAVTKLFGNTPLAPHVLVSDGKGTRVNVALLRAMREFADQPLTQTLGKTFEYNPDAGLGDSLAKTLGLDKLKLDDLKRMGLVQADGVTLDPVKLKALASLDPAQLASSGAVFDSGNVTPRVDLENAGRRAHLEQAPHLSYTMPRVLEVLTGGRYNPFRAPMRAVDWAVNSQRVPAKALRWGTRFGVLPGISTVTALNSLDQQSKAEVLLKKLDEMDISPEARASLKRRILESQKAVGIKEP